MFFSLGNIVKLGWVGGSKQFQKKNRNFLTLTILNGPLINNIIPINKYILFQTLQSTDYGKTEIYEESLKPFSHDEKNQHSLRNFLNACEILQNELRGERTVMFYMSYIPCEIFANIEKFCRRSGTYDKILR